MPLDMPESVLVRFSGTMQPGITLRDLVQAIPYTAIQMGLLTTEKKGKKNVFSGRVLEIEGLPDLKCEQAFELSDASAERSAAGCTIKLGEEPIVEYLNSNVVMLKWMIAEGYGDARTLERRIVRMEEWLANPVLMEADPKADYACVIDINLDDVKEPILALPNDPDASALLSEVEGAHIDEVRARVFAEPICFSQTLKPARSVSPFGVRALTRSFFVTRLASPRRCSSGAA
jgi:aconitate hydratase 2/2-methylisocitrate dehydratase